MKGTSLLITDLIALLRLGYKVIEVKIGIGIPALKHVIVTSDELDQNVSSNDILREVCTAG